MANAFAADRLIAQVVLSEQERGLSETASASSPG
jgi:hypothetical protein